MKYTKELLAPVVAESKSYAEVIRRLGLDWSGGTQNHLVSRIKSHGLNTSHFLGQGRNCGTEHKGGNKKLHWSEVLVLNRRRGWKEGVSRLRQAMIDSGIPYVCACCGCRPEWRGQPLILEIDHENGDSRDNRRGNVRFLCPNCHSQTENFGNKGRVVKLAKALPSDGRDSVGSSPIPATKFTVSLQRV
jgi:hypothetical protein